MKDRYFTVEVKPTVTASKQHIGVFTAGDVLFDWTEVQIPKGTSRCIGASMLVRPKGNATPTANNFGAELLFSKTNTQTLGTINGTPDKVPSNDFLGLLEIETETSYPLSTLKSTTVGMAGRASNTSTQANVLITPSQTGDNVGFDKFYLGGLAGGAHFFTTIIRLNDASGNMDVSVAGTTIATDGSSMDIRNHFIAGDILHAHDDAVIGTVASVTDATDLELTANFTADALADDDFVYNIHPIRIILFFEK